MHPDVLCAVPGPGGAADEGAEGGGAGRARAGAAERWHRGPQPRARRRQGGAEPVQAPRARLPLRSGPPTIPKALPTFGLRVL